MSRFINWRARLQIEDAAERFFALATAYWQVRAEIQRSNSPLMIDLETAMREASPTGAVTHAQQVKVPAADSKIVGRKRDIAVNTNGGLLIVNLRPLCQSVAI